MNSDRSGRPAGGPFDEAADITQEFWGTTRGWVPRHPDDGGDDTAGTRRTRRGGISGLRARQSDRTAPRVGRTRQHGVVRPGDAPPPPQSARDELANGWPLDDWSSDDWATAHAYHAHDHDHDRGFVDEYDDGGLDEQRPAAREVPLTPSRQVAPLAERLGVGAVDPLLLRLGVMVLIGVLMAPLALALRSDDGGDAIRTSPVVAAAYGSPVAGAPQTAGTPETVATEPAVTDVTSTDDVAASTADVVETAAPTASTEAPAAPSTAPEAAATTSTEAPVTIAADQDTAESVAPAVATEEADRVVPACPQQYEASPGDSWYRIAEAAGVSPGELFTENGANAQTVILPGDSICLPTDATMPAPLAPPTTQPPATTVPATTPPTTVASAPPTTKAPASTVPPSKSEVEQIIRDVWPDELEDKALEVAWRESKYQPAAYNGWCCYGLFQIHWGAHKGWLATIGIDSTSDLLDAQRNTEVAYLIYQRSGGWGPWGG